MLRCFANRAYSLSGFVELLGLLGFVGLIGLIGFFGLLGSLESIGLLRFVGFVESIFRRYGIYSIHGWKINPPVSR